MILVALYRRMATRWCLAVLSLVIVFSGVILGQGQDTVRPKTNDERAQELLNDKRYPFEDLLKGKPEATANAESIFTLTSDRNLKQRLASILISIGVKDPIYFDYLTHAAKETLQDRTPWPTLYDDHGDLNQKALNPEFLEWCKKHGLRPLATLQTAYYETPNPWYYLAAAGDPRAYGLLIQGLHSHNLMIAAAAAQGLAKLQDSRAVAELIATGRSVPGEARYAIVQSLLYFPAPEAQAAAEELMTNKKMLEIYRQEMKAKGLKALFPW